MISKTILQEAFQTIYHQQLEHIYFSPGRINLIGEHIDYHGGFVFPAAIQLGTYGVVSKREDRLFYFYSKQFPSKHPVQVDMKHMTFDASFGWVNYMKGVLDVVLKKGIHFSFGLNIYVDSDLPKASGLSSSASIEMLMAWILKQIYQLSFTRTELALIAQEAERNYLGVQSGIMDQLSIALGKKDHALFMNTSTLEVTYHPLDIKPYRCVIMNTNYQRTLHDSKYNERVKETFEASNRLQEHFPHARLVHLNSEDISAFEHVLKDDILLRRIRHIITEQARTLSFKKALDQKDIVKLASFLNDSHVSLKNDYEVTGKHLDVLVEASRKYAIGARMTGAGFGGCAIAFVEDKREHQMIEHVSNVYKQTFGFLPSFYTVELSDGVNDVL